MKKSKRLLSLLLALTMAFSLVGNAAVAAWADDVPQSPETAVSDNGENAPSDPDKNTVTVTVKTDKDTVGAALVELNLVSGSDSEYGLMVDTVNGITLDYNKDGKYWAFYINGEYATTGVDSTPVEADATYAFVAE